MVERSWRVDRLDDTNLNIVKLMDGKPRRAISIPDEDVDDLIAALQRARRHG